MISFSPAPAPAFILELARRPVRTKAADRDSRVELDTEAAIGRAIDYLKNNAPKAIAFDGGNDTTYKVATRLRDFGVSEGVAFDILAEHWNEAGKAEPPWDAQDLLAIVGNAYAYATAAWGGASGLADFDDVSKFLETPKKEARSRIYWLGAKEASATALARVNEPLVKGVLDQDALSMLYGASNSGKTFIELDIAFHIAAGLPWNGRPVSQGLVVYVAAEGGRGILKRIKALMLKHGAEDVPLAIVPCPVNLLSSKADIKALIAAVREAETHYGLPCKWLVVDTLSRALAGGDEHGPTDMGTFIRNLDGIRATLKTALGIVHHTGKNEAAGARGWSGMQAAVDTEIEVAKSSQTVSITKQRDLEPIPDMRFKLERLVVGKDADGAEVSTCVVHWLSKNEFVSIELSGREQAAYDVFCRCLEHSESGVIGSGFWDDSMFADPRLEKLSERTLRTLKATLAEIGKVKIIKKGQYVSGEPAGSAGSAK